MIITQQTMKQSSPAPTTAMMLPQIFTGKVQAPCQEEGSYSFFLIGGDNDDLIQEGMIALYKAIRAFRADRESSFVHYASLCIDNQLYNVIKVQTDSRIRRSTPTFPFTRRSTPTRKTIPARHLPIHSSLPNL